ncbi:MAG: FxLYD domain-containing protein [Chloroflexota bacterium]
MKNKVFLVAASAVVILSIMAFTCNFLSGGATEPPVTNPPVTAPPVGALEILSTSSFTDQYGGFYVVGEVMNNADTPVSNIELSIQLTDAAGASLLRDDTGNVTDSLPFYPILWTIAPGESTPFSFWFDAAAGMPANYSVAVSSYDVGEVNRGQLQSQNVQIIEDTYGDFILTGELVNLSDQWVHIWGLAGGVLDDANTVLSTDWTGTYTAILAPAGTEDGSDHTPFSVSFPVPQIEATQWSLWWDADIVTDMTDYDLGVNVTNSYFDEFGAAHLVGTVENYTDTPLTTTLVGGLYAEDGTVLDASYAFLPLTVQPGDAIPFDISYFGSVNYNPDQAALVATYTAQFDPWSTYPPFYSSVALTPTGETIQKSGGTWTVTGNVTNTTDQNLNGVTVVVVVLDPSGALVAMGYDYVYPDTDVIAPGTGGAYEVYIYLDPAVDTTGFTTQTIVVGDVSE